MESFRWSNSFATGLPQVDEQHHRLVDLINRFGSLLDESGDVGYVDLQAVLNELIAYAHYHFAEEERTMTLVGIDARHLEYHRHEHTRFLQEVNQMQEGVMVESSGAAERLLNFLTHWLAYHILRMDHNMSRQLIAIRSGKLANQAYLDARKQKPDAATEPLLNALHGLFRQVWERNRKLQELNRTLESKVAERTRSLTEANQELKILVQKLEAEEEASRRLSDELAAANRHFENLAMTDLLTGLANRRHGMSHLEQAWDESLRKGEPLSCLLIDADGFKQINDTYGHDAGDVVLRRLADLLKHSVRTDDLPCRLGGDEFMVICPGTALSGALQLAEHIRATVAELVVAIDGCLWRGSISVGVAERAAGMTHPQTLLKAADEAVYAAKRGGRNRVAVTS
ncbi:MAG: bacteriohemerythrin [Methylococcaceae bacterium]|nr:bacteriohemerythrin [Methylococcaceae bacterium]